MWPPIERTQAPWKANTVPFGSSSAVPAPADRLDSSSRGRPSLSFVRVAPPIEARPSETFDTRKKGTTNKGRVADTTRTRVHHHRHPACRASSVSSASRTSLIRRSTSTSSRTTRSRSCAVGRAVDTFERVCADPSIAPFRPHLSPRVHTEAPRKPGSPASQG